MKSLKPLMLSFSLLAFTGAYAQDAKKESTPAAKPAMSQAETKDDKASTKPAQSSPPSSSAQTSRSTGASAGATGAATVTKDDKSPDRAASGATSAGGMAGGMSVKKLRGMDVVDAQGKDLGEIDEVMLDMQSGRVHAVVLGFGGFLGLGEKHFAFPVSDLQPAKDKDKLQLSVDKEKLKDREGFAKGKYPEPNDDYWTRIGQGGAKADAAAGATGQKANLMRASQVIGKDVQDQSGKDVGEIDDIILSSDRTRIQHVVMDVEGAAGKAHIEPKSLSMGKEKDKLVINMSADQLKSQAKPADKDRRTERTRPVTSGSAAAGGTAGAATGASGTTTRTVPIERDNQPKTDTKASDSKPADSKASGSASGGSSSSGSASAGAGGSAAGASASKAPDSKPSDSKASGSTQSGSGSGSASAGAGGSAAGASASKKGFAELDKDNDGSLSQMEAAADANAKSNFEKLDKNSDKKLSRSEYEGGQGAAAGATAKPGEDKAKSK